MTTVPQCTKLIYEEEVLLSHLYSIFLERRNALGKHKVFMFFFTRKWKQATYIQYFYLYFSLFFRNKTILFYLVGLLRLSWLPVRLIPKDWGPYSSSISRKFSLDWNNLSSVDLKQKRSETRLGKQYQKAARAQ